jgi:RNA polymerase sigma-54 factor
MAGLTPTERKLGEAIIGNLSDDGYLNASLEDLARETQNELEDAEEVLKIIQKFDPVGVGARGLGECLMIQAHFMEPRQPLMEKIIEHHLGDLERKNYSAIAKALVVPIDKVIDATKLILELEPKPGRSFQGNDTQYITPDIYVYKVADEYVIVLNEDGMPKLRISPYYKSILAGAQKEGNKTTKEYVQDKLRSAIWLIKSIHNRQKTIYKVTDAIVKRQRDFFEKGVQHLKPMILKDVANDIGMHESTISRVTTNKFVHTPVGIFELKYFFNSSINSADGGDSLASEAVKEKIKNLITKEDPKNPLSDQKIVELLRNDNIEIARRTVAKYREMLNILSSGQRKKVF